MRKRNKLENFGKVCTKGNYKCCEENSSSPTIYDHKEKSVFLFVEVPQYEKPVGLSLLSYLGSRKITLTYRGKEGYLRTRN